MVVAIIQARCNSSRLKNKVLENVVGKPLIERIIDRVEECSLVHNIVVATSKNSSDDVLEQWCRKNTVNIYRGCEDDVLSRYYESAVAFNASIIVRITADDPLKDPDVIDRAIALQEDTRADYVSNTLEPTFPEGIDVEVFTFEALEKAHNEAKLSSEREHVTPYIWKNKKIFHIENFAHTENLSHMRWTVDYKEDLDFIIAIYEKLHDRSFRMNDVLNVISDPDFVAKSKKVIRNEGYMRSLSEESNVTR